MTARTRSRLRRVATLVAAASMTLALPAVASAQTADPRGGLQPGTDTSTTDVDLKADAGQAILNLERLGRASKPAYANSPGALSGSNVNSDIAFTGDHAIVGNYSGFGIYDVSDPTEPTLQTTVTCPGSQNDVSVYGDLLFLSVEQTSARIDCKAPVAGQPGSEVFRGVRIFDISDKANPVNLGGVQTCKGSHTHTIVTKPGVEDKIWIYVSGTAGVRPSTQLAGCNGNSSLTDPTTANFRIDVIEVPLATPAAAKVVSGPRIFSRCGSSACEADFAVLDSRGRGALNELTAPGPQPTNAPETGRAPGGQTVAQTSACHDITAYPAIGLAAGACQGDGLLLDISDPVNPVRIDNVTDNNFAYWHSATFNNDGTKVVFTDEWGGGSGARCRPTDPENWGANAIFDIVTGADGKKEMQFASYYSIPNNQSVYENCVAHNGSLVRSRAATSWCRRGTRAACRCSTSPTRRTRRSWPSSTAARSTRRPTARPPATRSSRPVASGRPTGTTARSSAARSGSALRPSA